MSQSSKTIWIVVLAVVIVAIIIGIAMWQNGQAPASPAAGLGSPTALPPTGGNGNSNATVGTSTGNSDASLNKDLNAIDNQLGGLSSDTQSVDQGLNDQAIPQGQ